MTDLMISDVKEVPETKTAPEVFMDFLSQDFLSFFFAPVLSVNYIYHELENYWDHLSLLCP